MRHGRSALHQLLKVVVNGGAGAGEVDGSSGLVSRCCLTCQSLCGLLASEARVTRHPLEDNVRSSAGEVLEEASDLGGQCDGLGKEAPLQLLQA